MKFGRVLLLAGTVFTLAACQSTGPYPSEGVSPLFSFPVTSNETPYSQCLSGLTKKLDANNKPVFSVGEVADKTGQINYDDNGHALTQGVSEMVISALYKTNMVRLVERLDLRIPLTEMKLAEQRKLARSIDEYKLPASDFIVVGALTELNYNITSGGAQLFI